MYELQKIGNFRVRKWIKGTVSRDFLYLSITHLDIDIDIERLFILVHIWQQHDIVKKHIIV